jgi:diacylglycerol kinase family enzyme
MIAAVEKPPAVLIVNPTAGRLPASRRAELTGLLQDHFDVEFLSTTRRDEAIEMSASAAERSPLVIAFGGDGHLNEVVNGLVGTGAALGIIPGGTMNVFARDLGVPRDPAAAIEQLALACAQKPRRVNLGRMDERYFTFAAGCGFDAEAAELVERDLAGKRRWGEPFFYWSAARVLAGSYRHRSPTMRLTRGRARPDAEQERGRAEQSGAEAEVSMAIVCNTGPYAYLFGRSIRITPDVRLGAGLDVFALKRMRIEALPWYAWDALVNGDLSRHSDALVWNDAMNFTLTSDTPFHRHVDGEPLPISHAAHFELAREALKVVV